MNMMDEKWTMEYQVVRGTLAKLATRIPQMLNEGWECQGGISVDQTIPPNRFYLQAMVRHEGRIPVKPEYSD